MELYIMEFDYFPLSIANGMAFCNRQKELQHLTINIQLARSTLLMSPRRYGKTSLVLMALEQAQVIYAHVDLFKEINVNDVAKSIINGIGKLLAALENKPEKLFRLAVEFFADLPIRVALEKKGLVLEMRYERNVATTIELSLSKLHDLAKRANKKVVLFIDEFQRLAEFDDNIPIEAAIRTVAQLSQHVTYLFSGSNRHLLQTMFFDAKRPFYKLCDTIRLDRIAKEHYEKHIHMAALKHWGKSISKEAIDKILVLTECHSYYVNLLCFKLWLGDLPKVNSVESCWSQCADEERSQIINELDSLSANQKKLLILLSRSDCVTKPTGREFASQAQMSTTSISQAMSVLIEKDHVYREATGYYRLIDPLMKYLYQWNT